MTTSPATPLSSLKETDKLLHKFEIDNIPDQYRAYYGIKRNNFFASIQGFPEMWQYYLRLDAIWMREFADLQSAPDATRMFPLLLYFNAHAKLRIAMELAFSGCMAEARSILRDAIEFVAHAHTMISDPELQKTWLSAPVRNYGDVFGQASGRACQPFVFDFSEESSKMFTSEGPLKGRSGFLVPSLKG